MFSSFVEKMANKFNSSELTVRNKVNSMFLGEATEIELSNIIESLKKLSLVKIHMDLSTIT